MHQKKLMQSEETICRHVCIYFFQVQFLRVPLHNYNYFSGRCIEAKKKCQTKQIKQQEGIILLI